MTLSRDSVKVRLPSGKTVLLSKRADPSRPWEPLEANGGFIVARFCRGDSSRNEPYRADRIDPIVLSRPDAEALANALNGFQAVRFRSRTPG